MIRAEKDMTKPNIALHLVGSPTSEFFYNLSMLYAKDVTTISEFSNLFVIAHPDGTWSVAENLKRQNSRLSLQEMMITVSGATIAVPHMFCDRGLTSIRIFFEEVLNIPLVGSCGHTAKIAQDKHLTKIICAAAGIPVPSAIKIKATDKLSNLHKITEFPVIVKPNGADNSDGLSLVRKQDDLAASIEKAFKFGNEVLVEKYIDGRELRGAVIELNGVFMVLPFIEYGVNEKHPIRNPEDKLKFDIHGNLLDQSDKEKIPATCPALLDDRLKNKLAKLMVNAHKALNCRDFSMFDFRIDNKTNKPYLLEAGLFWSFSEKSMISTMVKADTIHLSDMTQKIWNQSMNRQTSLAQK